jgi:hypothetical protein
MAKNNITYYWGERSLLIKLGNRTHSRIRAIYFIEFIFTAGMATVFLFLSLPLRVNFVHLTATLGASSLYLLAAHRLLARLFFTEQLLLDSHSLTIIRKSIFSQTATRFEWNNIGVLHYEGKGKKTDHPLKGKYFDIGFETHEHLIQTLHHEGNLYVDSPEGRIYFAAGVYSWDAEEMVQIMKMYTGPSLQLGPEWKEMLQEQELDD